ncbi:hypothetical protein BC936DRAFT_149791 [Jimgerdemannia flammicorona]|uniref:Amino acid permease/ SLC12A domain-containing protein n=2 Tax=Jimgerdemannia flammicorona TaxID=994334 RepID=A0A433Q6N1_9FUNG|nr:hypothetical protein BC936DRAFT_149791 [Jimgerdemannia flammicorona]RUS25436.1 amino acid permease/ SLC12A domain-containing protein [Jimgerdemannia flammicorona]
MMRPYESNTPDVGGTYVVEEHREKNEITLEDAAPPKLNRALKARHITMISIGGTIGTGLFVASGSSIATAGPAGALVAYMCIGIMVYFMMSSLGEMATYLPISGSFNSYAGRFIDPALGFALGWNYWYSWAVTVAVELAAAGIVVQYWLPDINPIVWSAVCLVIMLSFNLFSVRGYGEAEYWFALIKVITVIVFIIIGITVVCGGLGGEYISTKTFNYGGFQGGFLGVLSVFLVAGFSFQGTELVGVTAGESENPRKNVPAAIKQVFWRILLFYVLAIFVIGLVIPYDDPNLLNATINSIAISPFTLVFLKAGLQPAAHIMNAIIITTVLSAGNSGLYASSRVLYNLALEGQAPAIFKKMTKGGIPIYSLLATTFIGALAFLASLVGNGVIYTWLLNLSGLTGFIAWCGVSASHYRFRKAYVAQGRSLDDLPYRAKLYPFGPIFALSLGIIICLLQGLNNFMANPVDVPTAIASYIGIPLFAIFYGVYKIVKGTKLIPLLEVDLDSGREEIVLHQALFDHEDAAGSSKDVVAWNPLTWKHALQREKK